MNPFMKADKAVLHKLIADEKEKIDAERWTELLIKAVEAWNTHHSHDGHSPYEVAFGRRPRDIFDQTRASLSTD